MTRALDSALTHWRRETLVAGDRRHPGLRRRRTKKRNETTHDATRDRERRRTTKLVRELGLLDATMIVMGSMIGSGIFLTSAESARLVGAPGWLLVAWVLSGLLTITGSLCCAELAAMMPRAGGQYVFLRVAYGRLFGFLFGWSLFLVVQTGTIAAVAVAFARFLGVFHRRGRVGPLPRHADASSVGYAVSLSTQQLVALVLIVVLTATNTRGLRTGKLIQNSFTFTKTAALFGLIVVGLTLGCNRESAAWTSSWWNPPANGWDPRTVQDGLRVSGTAALVLLLGRAMIGPLFSQSAWNNVTFTGGEVRDPGRTLPRALVLGCGSVVALYLLANVAYVVTLSLERDPARGPGPRRHGRDGRQSSARAGTSVMAGGDPDLDVWLPERPDPGRGAGLLRDGPRRPLLRRGRHHQPSPRARPSPWPRRESGRPC